MDTNNFSFEQGTIEFWVKANKFEWNNNEEILLFKISREEGRIVILKDKENKLEAIYQKGEEKSKISADVSNLSSKERHQIAFSWSRDDNELILYLDRGRIKQGNIY